ncbi:MAG: SCP2 sterol-binding domain-containing protein [Desulfobacterota bacterium]|jgi:putative sterol carrier protein|nr:SCP2 sterol-binding domain-containing protein [Thermodesulfobacteriota bacterium]
MEHKVAYLSQQWRDEAEKRLKAELSPEKMKHLTSSVAYVYVDCPDGKIKYLYFKMDNGQFSKILVGENDPPDADFRVTGPYEIFASLTQGKIKAQWALMRGKLKLKGNMVKALKLASLADRMNKIFESIPTHY